MKFNNYIHILFVSLFTHCSQINQEDYFKNQKVEDIYTGKFITNEYILYKVVKVKPDEILLLMRESCVENKKDIIKLLRLTKYDLDTLKLHPLKII